MANNGGKILLGVTDRNEHKAMRRMIDPLYTLKSVRESEGHFDGAIEFFVDEMKAKEGQVVDMVEWMVVLAIDAITQIKGCLTETP